MGILLCLWHKQETSVHLHSIPFKLTHYDSIMLESEPAGLTLSLQKAISLEQVSLKSQHLSVLSVFQSGYSLKPVGGPTGQQLPT